MANIKLCIDPNYTKNQDKLYPIYIVVKFDGGGKMFINTDVRVFLSQFSNGHIVSHPKAADMTMTVLAKKMRITSYMEACRKRGVKFTKDALEMYMSGATECFNDFCKRELKSMRRSENTITNYVNFIKRLDEFNPAVNFCDINYSLGDEFIQFCFSKGNSGTTTAHWMTIFKVFMNIAVDKDLMDYSQYKKFCKNKVKQDTKKRKSLSEAEIALIEGYSGKYTDVRDMFLFMCYTGLRFGGMSMVSLENVSDDMVLSIRQKTMADVYLPLKNLYDGKPVELLTKYGFSFPKMDGNTFNLRLEKIMADVGINKHVTSHVGRHTFGSAIVRKTNDPVLAKELLGHKNIKTTMIYVHMNQNEVNEKLNNVNW